MNDDVTALDFYTEVGFRPAVETEVRETDATFRLRRLSFDVEFPAGCQEAVAQFCASLRTGTSPAAIGDALPFALTETTSLLDTLDRYGFLTERARSQPGSTRTGPQHSSDASNSPRRTFVSGRAVTMEQKGRNPLNGAG